MTITVNADNDGPTVDAGPDQTVNEGDAVSLAGSGVDPEGESLTYTWVQTGGPSVTLDDPNSSTPSFAAPEGLSNSDITFELQVSDGTNTSADTVTITVNRPFAAPWSICRGKTVRRCDGSDSEKPQSLNLLPKWSERNLNGRLHFRVSIHTIRVTLASKRRRNESLQNRHLEPRLLLFVSGMLAGPL